MRALIRLILPAVLVMAMTAGSADEGPRLLLGEDPDTGETASIGVVLADTVARGSYSLGGWVMCLNRPGSVTIDKIDLVGPDGGIVLQAFSSRLQSRTRAMIGNAEQPLTEVGFPARSPAVTTVCAKENQDTLLTELGLQYGKTGDATAHSEGVRLTYTSSGRQRTVDFALDVRLCAPDDTDTEQCRDLFKELRSPDQG
ncbi:hypothetical protein Sme01_06820 [Sphaerisporangium melleum]|uniref:Secreted protein n=1 Tax=Sphaerisporangium melleum TaxID=321316 RepID=A0A917QX44_9ACTN|nr:hypothetical protein [Sphaerisporangium melleum]GGK73479.1 hypothetical protein GCM10007964_15380 [Sphaerisporangium melleum]GII68206.1 hypothetical protein Sme01_06820 [Sphaerisporangium melleum]